MVVLVVVGSTLTTKPVREWQRWHLSFEQRNRNIFGGQAVHTVRSSIQWAMQIWPVDLTRTGDMTVAVALGGDQL